jgi:hypothetical protein
MSSTNFLLHSGFSLLISSIEIELFEIIIFFASTLLRREYFWKTNLKVIKFSICILKIIKLILFLLLLFYKFS